MKYGLGFLVIYFSPRETLECEYIISRLCSKAHAYRIDGLGNILRKNSLAVPVIKLPVAKDSRCEQLLLLLIDYYILIGLESFV